MLFRWLVITSVSCLAQTVCQPTLAYSPCEIAFDLNAEERKQHPNPYWSVELRAEVRSPEFKTYQAYAYYDGAGKMVIRFAPTQSGPWDFRVTSNLPRWNGTQGQFQATPSDHPGYVIPRNVRHWSMTETRKPHLWMGDTMYTFASIDRGAFDPLISKRAEQKFNHIRGHLMGADPMQAFPAPDKPNYAFFDEVDKRVRAMNEKGLTADLIIGRDENHLAKHFPERAQRERLIRFLASRYAAYGITWQLMQEFEEYADGRAVAREIGEWLKKYDPVGHPRTAHTVATSAPLLGDGWMDYILYQSSDDHLNAIERQIFTKPFVNSEFGYENSGAGKSHDHHVASDEFRKRLWRSAMNGQYPTFGNTGTYGGKQVPFDAKFADSPGAKFMTNWFDFFSKTRYWDLEPYFDVDGGRAMALEGIEYIVYVEKPSGPVEVLTEKHGYEIYWFNPITGEYLRQKDWKGEKWVGEAPNATQDWVLHISRDGKKEGMLRSYKFEARHVPVQELESQAKMVPFEIAEPAGDTISVSKPPKFSITLKRQTRATRAMQFLITGEVTSNGQGYRVMGTGASGTLKIPPGLQKQLPGVLLLRVSALNANGKAYAIDRVFKLVP
ncbi:MAG: DUF4038 domain-containing protein [Acidobacteria bacterium]|nr:DUF4038 domain-containing protein [Acidobacteriota bacterium]